MMDKTEALQKFREDLVVRYRSTKTIQQYCGCLGYFIDRVGSLPPTPDVDIIKKHLYHLAAERKLQPPTINAAYMSIKVFYYNVLGQDWPEKMLGRAKQKITLPEIFSQSEMEQLISTITNLKHRAIVCVLYSTGIRMEELLNLQITDIVSKQNYVLVRDGKGGKDRTTLLSALCLGLLRTYYLKYRPTSYLFFGKDKSMPYSRTSVNCILKKSAKKAGIKKNITAHLIRHSFATHMLENGTHLYYLKELLGHKSLKTTMVYLHLCRKDLSKVISPLDSLFKGKQL